MFIYLVAGVHLSRFIELCSRYALLHEVMDFWWGGVCRISVEAFFVLSGYLFFRSYHPNWDSYRNKIKRRVKTLLIPYLVWAIVGIAIEISLGKGSLGFASVIGWLGLTSKSPSIGALWYVRDLFLVCLISPLVFWLINRKWLGLGCLVVLGFVQLTEIPWYFRTVQNMFWFGSGAYLALHSSERSLLLRIRRPWSLLAMWLLAVFVVQNVVPDFGLPFDVLELLYALTGIPVVWNLTSALNALILLRHMLPHVFLYYCVHTKLNALISLLWFVLFPMTGFWLTIGFFIVPILGFICCVIAGKVAQVYLPRVYGLITGRRGIRRTGIEAV